MVFTYISNTFRSYYNDNDWLNGRKNPYQGMKINTEKKYDENAPIRKYNYSNANKLNFFNKEYRTLNELIITYYLYYRTDFYLQYPEYVVYKLKLDTEHLKDLPEVKDRTRKDIRNWMFNSGITFEQFKEVGF